MVRPWLLPVVYERLSAGRGEFLAELRPAFPLFVRFGGIDFDDDDDAIEKLDAFVRHAQRIITASGGNLLHLTLGDKGAYLCAVFGSPVAHENDAARAGAAALELRGLEGFTAATGIQIGIARGRLRSGTYGHARRQAFTCLGDAVNLAARLMARAPSGQIYATEGVYRAAGNVFDWEKLPPIALKGKADLHAVFALIAARRHAARRQSLMQRTIVGREAELAAMVARLDEAVAGKGCVLGICADAGVGKSRLIEELVAVARQREIPVADGECQSFGRNTSYFVWRDVWSLLFRLGRGSSKAEQATLLEQELAQIEPALVRRAPLLATLLDLPIADNALTRTFDAKLRKTSLEGLLVKCLQAQARETPLVVVLEDCQWLDPLSRDLLVALTRALPTLRVLIVLAYRPSANASDGFGMEKLPQFERIELAELDHEQAEALIRAMLRSADGSEAEPPRALIDLVSARAQGNPFFIEELVDFITQPGHRPQGRAGAEAARSAGEPAQPDSQPDRQPRRIAAAAAQGRKHRRPGLSRADAARHLPRARKSGRDRVVTGARRRAPTSSPSTPKPSRRTCSSTSSRRRSPTRACRSRSGRCCTSGSPATSRHPRPMRSTATSTSSRTTTGAARTCPRSANTCVGPATLRRHRMRTRRQSTTSNGWRRWWSRVRASTCC